MKKYIKPLIIISITIAVFIMLLVTDLFFWDKYNYYVEEIKYIEDENNFVIPRRDTSLKYALILLFAMIADFIILAVETISTIKLIKNIK